MVKKCDSLQTNQHYLASSCACENADNVVISHPTRAAFNGHTPLKSMAQQ
jgi:hypothetical protein